MKTAKIAGIVVVGLLLISGILVALVDADQFRPKLETELSTRLGRAVKLGHLRLSILGGRATASEITIADDPKFSTSPFLKAKSMGIDVELLPLIFSKQLRVNGVLIDEPEITLLSADTGQWNYSSLGEGAAGAAKGADAGGKDLEMSVQSIRISGGRVTIGSAGSAAKPTVLEKVNLSVKDYSRTAAFPFEMDARIAPEGSLSFAGKAGPIPSGNTALTPLDGTLRASNIDLALLDPQAGGILNGQATVETKAQDTEVKGEWKLEKLRLAPNGTPARVALEVVCAAKHHVSTRSGTLEGCVIRVGKASASLSGKYDLKGDSPAISLRLNGNQLPIDEVAGLLPAFGVKLPAGSDLKGGTLTANFETGGTMKAPVTNGSVRIANTKLTGFDIGAKMSTIASLAGVQAGGDTGIQELSANLNSSTGGSRIDAIRLIVPSLGDVEGNGTVSASEALDFRMLARLNQTAATGGRDLSVPFRITGTASNPAFQPDTGKIIEGAVGAALERNIPADSAAGSILKGFLGGQKKKPRQ
jgi:AsmA protein